MEKVIKIPLIASIALIILVPTGFIMKAHGALTQEQAQYEAKLAFCYDLLETSQMTLVGGGKHRREPTIMKVVEN
jgi:hypothetical protein